MPICTVLAAACCVCCVSAVGATHTHPFGLDFARHKLKSIYICVCVQTLLRFTCTLNNTQQHSGVGAAQHTAAHTSPVSSVCLCAVRWAVYAMLAMHLTPRGGRGCEVLSTVRSASPTDRPSLTMCFVFPTRFAPTEDRPTRRVSVGLLGSEHPPETDRPSLLPPKGGSGAHFEP